MHDDCNYDCAHSEFSADNKSHLEVNSKSGAQVGHKDPLGDPDCKYYYCDAFLWLTKIWHKDPLGNPVKECDFVICDWYVLLSIPVDERCLADSSVSGKNNLRIKRLKTFLLLFHLLLCLFKRIYSYYRIFVTSDKYQSIPSPPYKFYPGDQSAPDPAAPSVARHPCQAWLVVIEIVIIMGQPCQC